MTEPKLINPGGALLSEIEPLLSLARKTKPLWAKIIEVAQEIQTLEGPVSVAPGNYLCRGIHNELWPQKAQKIFETYQASGLFDEKGWQRFDPKPDTPPVEVVQVNFPFLVVAQWGQLKGKAGDYVVRSTADKTDVWIVNGAIFEASYESVQGESQ